MAHELLTVPYWKDQPGANRLHSNHQTRPSSLTDSTNHHAHPCAKAVGSSECTDCATGKLSSADRTSCGDCDAGMIGEGEDYEWQGRV